jgi:hypothetical protein
MAEASEREPREHRELRYRKVRDGGEAVRTIEVVFDGQNLHAYPVEDK